jgi:hypothetical protein
MVTSMQLLQIQILENHPCSFSCLLLDVDSVAGSVLRSNTHLKAFQKPFFWSGLTGYGRESTFPEKAQSEWPPVDNHVLACYIGL